MSLIGYKKLSMAATVSEKKLRGGKGEFEETIQNLKYELAKKIAAHIAEQEELFTFIDEPDGIRIQLDVVLYEHRSPF